MVYKKYIKKKGKVYGPYFYKSVKKDGRVITEYMGKSPKSLSLKKYLFLGVLGLVIFLFLVLMITSDLTFVGRVTLDIESNYKQDQFLEGVLRFSLEEDELIPASTKVMIDLDNISYDYILSDLIFEETISGNFSIKGRDISGSGEGYGFVSKEVYPNVSFTMEIYSEVTEQPVEEAITEEPSTPTQETPIEEITPENITEEPVIEEPSTPTQEVSSPEESITEEPEEIVEAEEEVAEEPEIEEEPEEIVEAEEEVAEEPEEEVAEEGAPITGAITAGFLNTAENISLVTIESASLELENTIQGEVSANNPFTYELQEGQIAKIVFSSQDVNLIIENNIVKVTTDYEGEMTKELIMNLTELNIPAKEGTLRVALIYNDTEFVSASKEINVGLVEEVNATNVTLPFEAVSNQTLFTIDASKTIYLENETIDFSGILIVNGARVSDQVVLEIFFNQSKVLTTNITTINGSYEYSLTADFELEGNYFVNVFYGNLSVETSFFYLLDYTFLEGSVCKEFEDNLLWSSGYTHSEEGSTEYYVWFPEHNCPEVGKGDCMLHNINTKSRVLYLNPYDEGSEGEGYVQILELSESVCSNPEKANYSGYIAYDISKENEKKWERYCGKTKAQDSKCEIEYSYNQQNESICYGIKTYASQYSIIDVVEIKYTWCWEDIR